MIVDVTWTGLKSLLAGKGLPLQLDLSQANQYRLFAVESTITYVAVIFLSTDNVDGDSAQNAIDKADFEANYMASVNGPTEAKNSDGVLQFTAEPRLGSEVIYGTHNFADKTTWFGDSIRVVDGAATDDGDGLSWSLAHQNIIDTVHGKVFDEDQYVRDQQADNPGDPHGFAVVVKVDSVEKTMHTPLEASGGDYEVDYLNGKIVFFSSQSGSTVEVSYSHENGSTFYITPDPGFNLDIEKAKAMWSDNFVMNDSVRFEIWGYAGVFAPQLGYPFDTRIPLAVTEYRTLTQLTSEASEYTPNAVPATGGTVRGTQSARHATHFRYGTIRRLISAAGIQLRVRTGSDRVLGGEFATATFYCVVRPE